MLICWFTAGAFVFIIARRICFDTLTHSPSLSLSLSPSVSFSLCTSVALSSTETLNRSQLICVDILVPLGIDSQFEKDSFKRFEMLLKKTENFSHCLSAGDVESADGKGFI